MAKVKKLNKFDSIECLAKWVTRGGWVYWCDRPMNSSFLINMQFRTILKALENGILYYAERGDN